MSAMSIDLIALVFAVSLIIGSIGFVLTVTIRDLRKRRKPPEHSGDVIHVTSYSRREDGWRVTAVRSVYEFTNGKPNPEWRQFRELGRGLPPIKS